MGASKARLRGPHLASVLLVLSAATVATAQSIQIPPAGLPAGSSYRVLCRTTEVTDATSANIDTYNAFAQSDADAVPELAALNTTWTALVSTSTVHARDNSASDPSPAGATGVPIFLPNGARVANDYDHLWGAATTPLLTPPELNSSGAWGGGHTWTGSNHDGIGWGPNSMGASNVIVGTSAFVDQKWFHRGSATATQQRPIYIMSDVLTVSAPGQNINLPPADLPRGAAYRVLMVTSTQRDATSPEIGDYNAFVQTDAMSVTQLAALGTTWKALVSTDTVHARDNSMTIPTPPGPTGVPIYLPNGVRIADDYDHLWGTGTTPLYAAPNVTSLGGNVDTFVFTGTRVDGLLAPGYTMGSGLVSIGSTIPTSINWIEAGEAALPENQGRLYGLSNVLTVPDVPAAQVVRAGTPANPTAFLPGVTGPIVGQVWNPSIDHSSFASTSTADLVMLGWGAANIVVPPFVGTLLVDTVFGTLTATPGSTFALALPADNGLVGVQFYSQAISLDASGQILFANAINVTIGNL